LGKNRHRIGLMFALTSTLIASGIALTWLLNPYGATRSRLIDPIFRKVKEERLVTPYLLQTARPRTVLVGSSRVRMGMRIEQGERDGVLNAAVNGATLSQISRIVEVALRNPELRRIIWGVDFFAFSSRWNAVDPNFDARIANRPEARIEDTLLSLDALGDGLDMFKRSLHGRARLRTTMKAEVPWRPALICKQFITERMDGLDEQSPAGIEAHLRQYLYLYRRYEFSAAQLELFRATVQHIRARNVELVLFVPPMSEYELELVRQTGHWSDFERFKRALAATAPFEDFAAYSAVAQHDEFYLEVIHFKASVGHQILRLLLGEQPATCDEAQIVTRSAQYVNAASIEEVLAREAKMRDRTIAHEPRYTRMAANAVSIARGDAATGNRDEEADGIAKGSDEREKGDAANMRR
jgi:hypothetical protein